ncbi:MAG: serine hydrolase [Bacteroidetes bacterium 41-46]|nr:MAG: serine hydrolase [Bacteroidetes bacterium 41-46]
MKKSTKFLISLLALVILPGCFAFAKSKLIDKVTERVMNTFNVPGVAVAVVKDGKIVHMKGYGVSSLAGKASVDEHTLFAIASNSKAFTGAALSILVREKKLRWDTKVCDIIPEFRLYDPYVTQNFTISDLLSHRGGYGLGSGDLMIWPDGSDFNTKDVIYNLRFLKGESPFRTKYSYNNLMYIVAGEVVSRVSGISWEEFVESRIMSPLGMTRSAASYARLKDKNNVIDPHVSVNGRVQVVEMKLNPMANPAGGIYSSVSDMSKWIIAQMEKREYEDTWTPQTIIPVRGPAAYKVNFSAYALGWRVNDIEGFRMVTHTGGLSGVLTQVTMIPDLKLGIIVFTNQQSSEAFSSITNTILDSYLGIEGRDRVSENFERFQRATNEARKIVNEVEKVVEGAKGGLSNEELKKYCGTFKDSWLGEVRIDLSGERLRFTSARSPKLSGEMFFYKGNTFIVKWDDRSFDADAFAVYTLDREGVADSFTMRAISPLTDFSYDFHDLLFKRQ